MASVTKNSENIVETPLMKQYLAIKAKYPDALLLFRVGDFYETFGEDAIKTAGILGIVLTRRANGAATFVELAGFPHHALDTYLPKLVRAGQRVAICDQLEDPKLTKTIVKRGVTEVVTPGIAFSDKILDYKSNNYLAAVHFEKRITGVAFLDVSTADFFVAQGSNDYIDKLIQGFKPSEIIIQKNYKKEFADIFGDKHYTYCMEDWVFTLDFGKDLLLKQFETATLKGYGVDNLETGIVAAGAALHYLKEMQHNKLEHIRKIARIEEDEYVWLDKFTIRNLELFYSANENASTLFDTIDYTCSPMGARTLKRWLVLPLKEKLVIEKRLDVVDFFKSNKEVSDGIKQQIKLIGDIERLISKVAIGRINPREVVQLKKALIAIEEIKTACVNSGNTVLAGIAEQLNPCLSIQQLIDKQIISEPPIQLNKGGVICDGVIEELDELRKLSFSGKDFLLQIQQREIERTGITSLKIAFNNVFGYFIEVRNTHKDKVPTNWLRKQTLVSAERYVTEELKEYEEKILDAEDKILAIEVGIFNEIIISLKEFIQPIQLNAHHIAYLDCLLSFAYMAEKFNYVKPIINDTFQLDIKNGRHPVIEKQLPAGVPYVANDVYLDTEIQQIVIITGPNMSGKSSLLRQTALIVLLAQVGSFVPADAATIGIVDKIFTRVGASDNISSGESTFMVEMSETASIINNLSERSLILLDEIGRGTSTYDGVSIAWAIAEYLHEHPTIKAKTLFATHYHELNELAASYRRVKNFNVSIKEVNKKIIFLRKLLPGGSEHSFGIHVAEMAGMPKSIINRANEILKQLEETTPDTSLSKPVKEIATHKEGLQLSFFSLNDPVLQNIKDILIKTDINTLTPVEALIKLSEIQKMVGG